VARKIIEEGVFIDGKPLLQYLEDLERDDKSREVEEVRKDDEKHKYRRTGSYADERQVVETRKVSRRVERWSARKIRKEYGIMAKPFKTHAENAIWAILEKGPLNVTEIGAEIDWAGKGSSLSAMVATVWHRLGDMHAGCARILKRESKNGSFSYEKVPGIDISVEAAIEKYKLVGKKQYKMLQDEKKGVNTKVQSEATKIKADVEALPSESKINDALEEVISKTLGVDVQVHGRVEIVFKWER